VLSTVREQLVNDVAEGRKMPVDKVGSLLTAIYTGQIRSYDTIGTFYDVVDDMQKTWYTRKTLLVYGKRPVSEMDSLVGNSDITKIMQLSL
jgi:ClpP class serine protease